MQLALCVLLLRTDWAPAAEYCHHPAGGLTLKAAHGMPLRVRMRQAGESASAAAALLQPPLPPTAVGLRSGGCPHPDCRPPAPLPPITATQTLLRCTMPLVCGTLSLVDVAASAHALQLGGVEGAAFAHTYLSFKRANPVLPPLLAALGLSLPGAVWALSADVAGLAAAGPCSAPARLQRHCWGTLTLALLVATLALLLGATKPAEAALAADIAAGGGGAHQQLRWLAALYATAVALSAAAVVAAVGKQRAAAAESEGCAA